MSEEISIEEYWKLQKKGNKFSAKSTIIDGITFQSLDEGARYKELLITSVAEAITQLQVHAPKIVILDAFTDRYGKKHKTSYYIPDFSYYESGLFVIEDVKGGKATRTAIFELKRKIILSRYPDIDFRIITM